MGSVLSFNRASEEADEAEASANSNFRFPPKTGTYFGSHFIMGGERFETPQPEQYLFGENADLNLLGSKPVPFPYPAPQSNEPTKTLKAMINIRKESLRFVKIPPSRLSSSDASGTSGKPVTKYNVEFTFDADCRCEITVMYFCTEEITPNALIYRPRDPKLNSPSLRYKAGANQQFTLCEHIFDPSIHAESDLLFDYEKDYFPVVIFCQALEGDDPPQAHATIASIDKHSDGSYAIKGVKQKLFVDGMAYLLQEIYGIENKNASRKCIDDDDSEENAAECVICMSDLRDTLILPCRHLCLCHSCADSLRYQANNCPICRAPFRALLQIRAVYRVPPAALEYPPPGPEMPVIQMNAIPGYEMVPLLEALNGPSGSSDISTVAAAMILHESARILNESEEMTENNPIAMTVMVAPNPRGKSDLETLSGVGKEAVMIVSEVTKGKMLTGRHAVKSLSDPEEDEDNFGEERDGLPDLEDFSDPSSPVPIERSIHSYHHVPTTEDDSVISGSGKGNSRVSMMIAAIDEFSDEDDDLSPKKLSPDGLNNELSKASASDSAQSTPLRKISDNSIDKNSAHHSSGARGAYASSLPVTPNCRLYSGITNSSTSTRSSGDSFTSSGSSKQLLPTTKPPNQPQ